MTYNVVMFKANIADVKANLSQYLRRVKAGETLVICERNVPLYEVRPIREAAQGKRPLGLAKGMIKFNPGWDDPMTEEELGDAERPIFPPEASR